MIDFKKRLKTQAVEAKKIKEGQIRLPSGKFITLNTQQNEALDSMKKWLALKGKDFFYTLSGYAGTGKTTLTYELLRLFRTDNRWADVAVSAPTHKAKKVISRATGEDAYTIQKLLGLRPNTELENFDINNPQFEEMAEKKIAGVSLLIIDEASMLNASLFDLIVEEAKAHRVKVLFMGDSAQLPPVNEAISRVFTRVDMRSELTKVERQSDDNPLMSVYDKIRSNIASPKDLFEHETKVNSKGEGIHFMDNQEEFENYVLPMFQYDQYKKDPDFIKLITYSNASVRAWNQRIRESIYGKSAPSIIEGEVLFAYNTIAIDRTDILIENSSDYVVKSISDTETRNGIPVYEVMLSSVDQNLKSIVQIVKNTESGLKKFVSEFNRFFNAAKFAKGKFRGQAWRQYYHFKNKHLLSQDIRGAGNRLIVKKDIDYGYAITVHKSQGSTFTNVAISEKNLDTNQNSAERNKLKYVAFSRPTDKAIIFTNKKT